MTLAFVCGCAGLALSAQETEFLTRTDPWGLILFRRNVDAPDQLRRLTAAFREVVGRPDAPVLVDQEGGRVQRLGPPEWPPLPAAGRFAEIWEIAPVSAMEAARLNARAIAAMLREVGVTVACLPLLDVRRPEGDALIGALRAASRA